MAFIRKVKKKSGTYLAEVEGKRIDGKVVQKFIRYIGKIPEINPKITSKSEQKQMRNIEIIQEILKGKSKKDLAILYGLTVRTVDNIKKRFDKDGIKGLIHTRKSNVETVKVSTPEQAAVVVDAVKNPNKTLNEIKKSTGKNMTKRAIKQIIKPVLESIKLKKKVLLEIQ